jgi:predicted aspartyl protease
MAYWAHEGEPYSVIDISQATPASPHTTAIAYLNGAEIRILFDTGTAASLLSLHAAELAGVKMEEQGMAKAGVSRGIGAGTVQTWVATFASLRIGAEETRDIKLRIGALTSAHADMLIGADFFLSHRVYVASSQGKLYFTRGAGPMLSE